MRFCPSSTPRTHLCSSEEFEVPPGVSRMVRRWLWTLQSVDHQGQSHLRYVSHVQSTGVADVIRFGDRTKMCYVIGELTEQDGWINVTCHHAGEGWCKCRTQSASQSVRSDACRTAEQKVLMVLKLCRTKLIAFSSRPHDKRCRTCGLLK